MSEPLQILIIAHFSFVLVHGIHSSALQGLNKDELEQWIQATLTSTTYPAGTTLIIFPA